MIYLPHRRKAFSVFGSNASFVNNDCSSLTGWTETNSGTGTNSQVTFDGKSSFKLESGASAGGIARLSQNVGTLGTRVVISIKLYHSDIGLNANNDFFGLILEFDDLQVILQFASDGLFTYDGASFIEAGTNLVSESIWQDWTFDIDNTTPASASADVYLNEELVVTGADVSRTGTYSDGFFELKQRGANTINQITYVDYVKVGDGFA